MGDRYYSTSMAVLEALATALARARKPLVITSYLGSNPAAYLGSNPAAYLGSNPAAVGELVQLADALAVPVIEASPNHVNFPDTHPTPIRCTTAITGTLRPRTRCSPRPTSSWSPTPTCHGFRR